jgi:hypothetical protein
MLKRLAILRRHIYDCVHSQEIPRWEAVMKRVEECYVIEYAIADKNGCIHKMLKSWEK